MRKKIVAAMAVLICVVNAYGRQPETGYRGMVDWDAEINFDPLGWMYGEGGNGSFYTGASTTHGYQFKPWLFVGGGVGVLAWPKEQQLYAVPVYAACRLDVGKHLFSPYFDVRLGGNTVHGGGIYFSSTVGLSVKVYNELGINVGLGYSMIGMHEYYTYKAYDDYTLNHWAWERNSLGHTWGSTMAVRVGLEF
ncbi:MAG: hypothetical protein NC402_03900 [Prevotella sp.]|nr:hypothetical protein [Prevotella sp.]MCM1074874.1 hypothetical protein [Ruminococcus sp.]